MKSRQSAADLTTQFDRFVIEHQLLVEECALHEAEGRALLAKIKRARSAEQQVEAEEVFLRGR